MGMTQASRRFESIAKDLGYSQKQLAERLGLTQQSISLYMQGKRPISKLLALALAFTDKVNPEWLLEGKGEKYLKDETR